MKKLLLTLAAAVLGMSAYAQDAEALYTLDFPDHNSAKVSGYTSTFTAEIRDVTFTITGFNNNNNAWAFIRCGRKTNASTATITSSAISSEINSVVINAKKNKTNAKNEATSAELLVADNAEFNGATSYPLDVNSLTGDSKDLTVNLTTAAANAYYQIKIVMPATNNDNGWLEVATVKFFSSSAVVKEMAELSFPESAYTIKLGEAFEAPALTKTTDGAVTYSSSNTEVATVDETTGDVTVLAMGTTTITATSAETDTYFAGAATYVLTVQDPNTFWAPECTDTQNSEFTFETITGEFQPWSVDAKYGLKASAFKNSAANASDAVAASPVLDFTNYGAPMTLNYRHALNQFKVNNVLIDCTAEALAPYVSIVAKAEGETEWTKIGAVNAPDKFSWNFFDGTEVDLSAYAGKKVQIGFRYVSTTECAGTWEVDNVVVKAQFVTTGITDVEADENAPVEYYNLQGVRVANPESGLYIRRQGSKAVKVLVK